jgi:hypothetical protein
VGIRPTLVPLGAAILAVLGGAASTGLLIPDAVAQVARRRDEERDGIAQLLVVPADDRPIYLADHSSHRSHSSHQSHRSSAGGGGDYGGDYSAPAPAPAPPPPKPATISFVAYPGGRIFVDGQPMGKDATGTLTLKAGSHTVRIENRFLGTETRTIDLEEGQTGVIEIAW